MPYSPASSRQAEMLVLATIKGSGGPTKEQVIELAELSRSDETVQETLFNRIMNPESFKLREIENTLVVTQQCLFIGSIAFVEFFKNRVYAIAALTNFISKTADLEPIARIQNRAKLLSQILRDEEMLQKHRENSVIPTSPKLSPNARITVPNSPQGSSRGRDLRTWMEWRPSSDYLPTPDPSPERTQVPGDKPHGDSFRDILGYDNSTETIEEEVEQELRAAINGAFDIGHHKMDSIAAMTFERGQLHILITVLMENFFENEVEVDARHLVNALKITKYCLLSGSDDFITWFREIQETLVPLTSFPSLSVKQLVREILEHLNAGSMESQVTSSPPTTPNISALSSGSTSSEILHGFAKDLSSFVSRRETPPLAREPNACVYRARLQIGGSTETVVEKVLTLGKSTQEKLMRNIDREIAAWTRVSHPNVAQLFGITREKEGSVGFITPFFENGSIDEYLKKELKRLTRSAFCVKIIELMVEITQGIEYLHNENIVHGDIIPSNIMIDDAGHVKLVDFYACRIINEIGNVTSSRNAMRGFEAPELLSYRGGPTRRTAASDVYAMAVTFVQIMSGREPYHDMRGPSIIIEVMRGGVPHRPMPDEEYNYIPLDDLWAMLLCCWARKPEDRPVVSTVREALLVGLEEYS